jgi:NADH dehydrogenase FAD-containing subunit
VDFDYLVVTTGASYPAPAKSLKDSIADIVADVKTVHAAIKAASSVLIVGGGPVGIESAGEIAQDYPDKTVTLVHSHPKFFDGPQWKPKLQTSILAKLEALKVKVILGDRVTVNEADRTAGWTNQTRTLTTDKGVAIASDVQIFAVGNAQFNTGFVASLGENVLNDQGRIKVRNTLQVEGHDNIYAAGDAAGLDSPLAYIAGAQGVLVAKNLVSALDGKKLGTTKPGPAIAFVTMGRKHGSAQLPFGVVGDWLVRSLKGKNMFLNQFQSKAVVKN